jgi:hypothetical protein
MTKSGNVVVAIVVDDNEDDRALAQLLQNDYLRVLAMGPLPSIEGTLAEISTALASADAPSVVLLDYRLDVETDVHFKGGSIGAGLREAMPSVPIVLFTTEERLREWVDQQPGISKLFDWQLIKGTILNDDHGREQARGTVISIATSFAEVAAIVNSPGVGSDVWAVIQIAMACTAGEIKPFRTFAVDLPHRESSSQIARWILQQPLQFPGPIISWDDARALVGIDDSSARSSAVVEWMQPAAYSGVFAEVMPGRFWRGRLADQVDRLFEDRIAPEDATERSSALSRYVNVTLQPEHCSWCGDSDVSRCCAVCSRGVDSAHALRPIGGPEWSHGRIVCFSCILEGNAESERFDESAEEIAEMIRTGEIEPSGT